jgi:hypothetical protein
MSDTETKGREFEVGDTNSRTNATLETTDVLQPDTETVDQSSESEATGEVTLDDVLKEKFGYTETELKSVVESTKTNQSVDAYTYGLTELSKRWDVPVSTVETRLGKVFEEMNKLPEDQRGKFDSFDGICELWKVIDVDTETSKVPAFLKSFSSRQTLSQSSAKSYDYKESEIRELMRTNYEGYKAGYDKIYKAYQAGRVLKDV